MARILPFAFALLAVLATGAARAEYAFALNSMDASVSMIDRRTLVEVKRIAVGKEPHHLIGSPDDKSVIVASAAGNELVFIDPRSGDVQKRVRNIVDPYHLGFSPDRNWLVINANRLDHVDLYRYGADDIALVKRLPLKRTPSHMAFDRGSSMVFVTLQESNEVAAIDLARQEIVWVHKVGKQPAGIWMTPDDRHLLVGIMGSDYVEVIDWRTKTTVKRIRTAQGAHAFQPLGDKRHVFVSNRAANSVSILDQEKLEVVDTFPVPSGPDCMEVSGDGTQLWLTARWARQVAVIDIPTRKVVKTINVGRSPHGVYFQGHAPRE